MKRATGLMALALLAPLPALADPYVMFGGAAGNIDMGDISSQYGSGADVSDNLSRVLVGIGGRVNQNLGVEAVYLSKVTNHVSQNGFEDSLSHEGVQLALLGYLPIARNVDLFAKVSANYLDTVYNTNAFVPPYKEDHNETHFGFGGGVQFNIAQNMSLRASLEQIQMQSVVDSNRIGGNPGDFNVNQGSVALMLYF
jgi:opacity protein-like surface antigen